MREEFDAAIGVSDQEKDTEVMGLDPNRAYMPNDLDSDNKTGRSIVADAKFVTESVEMDFSKEETTRDKKYFSRKLSIKWRVATKPSTTWMLIILCKSLRISKYLVLDISSVEPGFQKRLNIRNSSRSKNYFDAL